MNLKKCPVLWQPLTPKILTKKSSFTAIDTKQENCRVNLFTLNENYEKNHKNLRILKLVFQVSWFLINCVFKKYFAKDL